MTCNWERNRLDYQKKMLSSLNTCGLLQDQNIEKIGGKNLFFLSFIVFKHLKTFSMRMQCILKIQHLQWVKSKDPYKQSLEVEHIWHIHEILLNWHIL